MPRTGIRTWVLATLGVAAVTLVACSQESPTSAARPGARSSDVAIASTAAAGSKPTGTGYEIHTATLPGVVSGNSGAGEVLCSPGKRALGGGFHILGGIMITAGDVVVYESSPRVTSGTDGWRLEAANRSPDTRDFEIWVVCAVM